MNTYNKYVARRALGWARICRQRGWDDLFWRYMRLARRMLSTA